MRDRERRGVRYWRNLALFTLGVVLVSVLASLLALSAWWAHNYTHPARHPLSKEPTIYELAYEAVTFPSTDGLSLAGWFISPQAEHRNGAVVILCHGYGSTRAGMLPEAHILAQHGYSTLLFDFRGHGQSEGDLVTLGYDEVQDVQGAVNYLLTRSEVDPERLGLLGHSMGGATAIRAAARTPEVKALVTEGAYASLADTIADDFTNLTGLPKFPFAGLMVKLGEWQTGLDTSLVQPVEDVIFLSPRPVLFIHGLADTVIPPENGRRLYQAAKEPKTLWQPEDVGHATAALKRPDEYEARVITFFDKALLSK